MLSPLAALAVAACLSGLVEPGAAGRILAVTPDTLRLGVGTSAVLTVRVTDSAGVVVPGATFSFLSTNPTIASVTPLGRVTAEGPGRARVVVESAGSVTSVSVETGLVFAALAAGSHHTCGLTTVTTLYCWGGNTEGQLGIGDRTDHVLPTRVPGDWIAVTAGDEHTCGLAPDGSAYCWGRGSGGRLGTGGVGREEQPARVTGGHVYRQLTAGGAHTCGITADSTALCWGTNDAGQIGDGTFSQRTAPSVVVATVRLRDISAGAAHTCGVDSAGAAWCWGANDHGQLAVDTLITLPQPTPRRAADSLVFTQIRAGQAAFTCGITSNQQAWCWGRGSEGQLGLGTTPEARVTPGALTSAFGDTLAFTWLAVGWAHTCGRGTDGTLMCWGTSRLGLPGLYFTTRPTVVLPNGDLPIAGFAHTCGRLQTGRVACWGGGQRGALGTGDRTSSDIPRPAALQLGDPSG